MAIHTIKKSPHVKAGTPEQWVKYLLEHGFELPEKITAAHAALVQSRKPVKKPEVPAVTAGSTDKEILAHLVAAKRLELFHEAHSAQRWTRSHSERALDRFEREVNAGKAGVIRAIEARLNDMISSTSSPDAAEVFDRAISVAVNNAHGILRSLETIKLNLSTQRVMDRVKVLSAVQLKVSTADVLSSASDWFGEDTDNALTDRLCPNGRPTLITAVAASKPLNFSDIEGKAQKVGMATVNEAVSRLSGDVDLNGHDVLPHAVGGWLKQGRTYMVEAWA
ncbi:hypothetical protein AB0B28_17510 [Glycomyces sp. NPDC046736]|uniref:hypothetical protein n=1 Tax=Glycomyces sp. NPDC046736 TaxID=3155615 RepID=UPI0033C0FD3F